MARFTLPRDLYWGKGSLENLKTLQGKKAVLVLGGGSMKRFGFVDKAVEYLKEAGIETKLFENVEPDPSVETVMKGAEFMREFEPDWIIAMGGGSPIDAAKAMWVFYEYPECTFEEILTPFSFPELRKKAKFCAIPSTSGTATEVTAFSVITDYAKGIKYPLADFNITPDVAIVDPELAETMPKHLVAYTGMDALTHAIEAYVSTLHGTFTDPLALKAIQIVNDELTKSYDGNMASREEMHYVSVWQEWHFPMRSWELYTLWRIKQELLSQQDIFHMVLQMQCICLMLLNTMQKKQKQRSVMRQSPPIWDWKPAWMHCVTEL